MDRRAIRYHVLHETRYEYDSAVSLSQQQLHLSPRILDWQRIEEQQIDIDPQPSWRRLILPKCVTNRLSRPSSTRCGSSRSTMPIPDSRRNARSLDDLSGKMTLLMWDGNESLGGLGGRQVTDYDLYYEGQTGMRMPGGSTQNVLFKRFMADPGFRALYEEKLKEMYEVVFTSGAARQTLEDYTHLIRSTQAESGLVDLDTYDQAAAEVGVAVSRDLRLVGEYGIETDLTILRLAEDAEICEQADDFWVRGGDGLGAVLELAQVLAHPDELLAHGVEARAQVVRLHDTRAVFPSGYHDRGGPDRGGGQD